MFDFNNWFPKLTGEYSFKFMYPFYPPKLIGNLSDDNKEKIFI